MISIFLFMTVSIIPSCVIASNFCVDKLCHSVKWNAFLLLFVSSFSILRLINFWCTTAVKRSVLGTLKKTFEITRGIKFWVCKNSSLDNINSVVIPNCIKPNCLRGGERDTLPWVAPEYTQLTGRSLATWYWGWCQGFRVEVKDLGDYEVHMEGVCLVVTSKKGRKKGKVHENHRHMMSIYFVN